MSHLLLLLLLLQGLLGAELSNVGFDKDIKFLLELRAVAEEEQHFINYKVRSQDQC